MLIVVNFRHKIPLPIQTTANAKKNSMPQNADPTNHARTTCGDETVHRYNILLPDDMLEGGEFLWQKPCNESPRAILFLAHGCNHRMTDWWSKYEQQQCVDCIGLPEEMAIVNMALQKQLVVVAASSRGTCWSRADGPRVARMLEALQRQQYRHLNLPILAFGASSGGQFVSSILPDSLESIINSNDKDEDKTKSNRLCGFISQIMATPIRSVPPAGAVWITMNRDTRTDEMARKLVELYRGHAPVVQHIRLDPLPIDPEFFARRIPGISRETSQKMVLSLDRYTMTTTTTTATTNGPHYLKEDPRRSNWRTALAPYRPAGDTLAADESPLSEVLNVAWGQHELTRDGVSQGLDLLLQHLDKC